MRAMLILMTITAFIVNISCDIAYIRIITL